MSGTVRWSCILERLIDPYLHEDFDKEEIEIMMSAASLYLLHSSSRRPTMKEVKFLLIVINSLRYASNKQFLTFSQPPRYFQSPKLLQYKHGRSSKNWTLYNIVPLFLNLNQDAFRQNKLICRTWTSYFSLCLPLKNLVGLYVIRKMNSIICRNFYCSHLDWLFKLTRLLICFGW